MKRKTMRILCTILTVLMIIGLIPANVSIADETTVQDYSISQDYVTRYPHGVIQLSESGVTLSEGSKTTLQLIRAGGTEGSVSVELKAVDISAEFGTDYTIEVQQKQLVQSDEYTGTLTEAYLEESGGDYITSDSILTDETYQQIIGYDDSTQELTSEETEEFYSASVGLVSDSLNISEDEAAQLIAATEQAQGVEAADGAADNDQAQGAAGDDSQAQQTTDGTADPSQGAADNTDQTQSAADKNASEKKDYHSPLHKLKDEVLGESTPANSMNESDMLNMDELLGNNDANLASSAVYDAAVGASLTVTFENGENEKTIVIHALDDSDYEPQEALSVGICNPTGGAEIGEIMGASVVIDDNDEPEPSAIGFETPSVSVSSAESAAAVSIVRTGCLNDYAEIRIHTVEGSAKEDDDYLPIDTTSVFLPGEETKTVIVPLLTSVNTQTEAKSFSVAVNMEAGMAELASGETLVTIEPELNGDAAPALESNEETSEEFYITLPLDKIVSENGRLFFDVSDFEDTPIYASRIEIDVTSHNGVEKAGYSFGDRKNHCYLMHLNYKPFGTASGAATYGQFTDWIELFDGESATFTFDGSALNGSPDSAFDLMPAPSLLTIETLTSWDTREIQNNTGFFDQWRLTTDDLEITEVRVYPASFHSVVARTEAKSDYFSFFQESFRQMTVTGESRIFDGTSADAIIDTETYEAGEATVPEHVYRGWTAEDIVYTLTDTAQEKNADLWGYTIQTFSPDLIFGRTVTKQIHEPLSAEDIVAITQSDYIAGRRLSPVNDLMAGQACVVCVIPLIRGENVDYIHVDEYESEKGSLMIGGKTWNNENVISDEWRVGDSLKVTAEPVFGYKCDRIEVTHPNGAVESIQPGDTVQLEKGLSLKPIFAEEDITITVRWSYPGLGKSETQDVNLADYVLSSDHAYTDNGDGSYTFTNMIPGDIVTLTLLPKNPDGTAVTKKRTGYWTRIAMAGETRLDNDLRFLSCVGDAYAFQVDDHDMEFHYYLIEKGADSSAGALVTGRVVTNGGTIKQPCTVTLTAQNADEVGVPVQGANVYVLSNDPEDSLLKDGTYYYTNATTDKNGYFTLFLPSYAVGLGYCVAIAQNDQIYQNVAIYQTNGETVYQLPSQNLNFQVDRMTVGSDMNTTEIALGSSEITIGVHVTIASGYRAQKLIFRSYDSAGTLIKEWAAIDSTAPGWTYQSTFVPDTCLKEGGKLTVELYDQYDRGQGEYDTGYWMKAEPKSKQVTLPQFDPEQSVTLPVIGDMTASFDMGSASDVTPQDVTEESKTDITNAGSKSSSAKHPLEITFGASKAVKTAVKTAKSAEDFETLSAQGKASAILSRLKGTRASEKIYESKGSSGEDSAQAASEDDSASAGSESEGNSQLNEKKSNFKAGKGSNELSFNYVVGAQLSLYSQDDKFYFEYITLYAQLSLSASATRQFFLYGIPIYVKFNGALSGEYLLYGAASDGSAIPVTDNYYYQYDSFASAIECGNVFHVTIKIDLGTGLGNPKVLSLGVTGGVELNIDYQPWEDGAGIATFNLDVEACLLGVKAKYNVTKADYGMFRTDHYTGSMDFSKVKNADRFKNSRQLLSYTDAHSQTEVYGSYEDRPRGRSLNEADSAMTMSKNSDPYDRILAEKKRTGVIDTITPALLPIQNGNAALYLRLDDDSTRGNNDFSAVAYSIIDQNGNESTPVYLDPDNTFDSDLTAAQIGGGRILAVWSDLSTSYGANDPASIGEALNETDLSYCIFDQNGIPGEVKSLTLEAGYEGKPEIAYDETTGKTFICYYSKDYETEDVTFGENNLVDLGNFLYNSYSNICFKVLDENGEVLTDYTAAESSYQNYETENGKGSLNGMRYLNTQIDPDVSQATIDEMTTTAMDGKAYVVYSLDADRSTATNTDRDLYAVVCDLSTMEQTEPTLLAENKTADTNPQLINYDGRVQLFWNDNGSLNSGDLRRFLGGATEPDPALDGIKSLSKMTNAASSYFVTVQPDGSLCVIWVDWIGTENGQVPALYFREYDPDYILPGNDPSGQTTSGYWGNVTELAVAQPGQDFSEAAYLGMGQRKMLLAYKITNSEEGSGITSYDSCLYMLKGGNRYDLSALTCPEYPIAGDATGLTVTASNTASLPSEKVTVKTELLCPDGSVREVGTEVFEKHTQSTGSVQTFYDGFTYPSDPTDYKIRVTAWDDELTDYPVVQEFDLPHASVLQFSNVKLNSTGTAGSYSVALDVKNSGNLLHNGHLLAGYYDSEGEGTEAKTIFTPLADAREIAVGAKSSSREVLFFHVPDELYSEEGVAEVTLAAVDSEGFSVQEQSLYLYKPMNQVAEPTAVVLNAENDALTLAAGTTHSLEGTITPYDARNGYHLVYSAADPSVASVDNTGSITANQEGETALTVSVVKNQTSLFISSELCGSDSSGVPIQIDGSGQPTGMSETKEAQVVLTKTIRVTVTGEHTHELVSVPAKEPTETEPGNIAYYVCTICGKYFEDAEGTREIADKNIVIIPPTGDSAKIRYQIIRGADSEWTKGSKNDLIFASNADFSKFVSVKIDGTEVALSNYKSWSGSTVVSLNAAYLETQAIGKHTLTIVSIDGQATTQFCIYAAGSGKPVDPKTGDSNNPGVWILLMGIMAAVIAALLILRAKKK